MTADTENPLFSGGETASSEPPAAPARKSPRRKVAVRLKAPALNLAEGAETPAADTPAKPRAPRRKKAAAEPLAAAAPGASGENQAPELIPAQTSVAPAPAPVQAEQPRVFSAPDLRESPVPEARVETRVIPPEVMEKIEAATARNFPHPERAEALVPAGADGNVSSASRDGDSVPPGEARMDRPAPAAPNPAGQNPPPYDTRQGNAKDERRYDGGGGSSGGGQQPFQGRRGDHRQHGRGEYQPRGDYPPRGGDQQQGRGDYPPGRGGQQQQGFRQQGGQGNQGGGQQRQGNNNYQGGTGGQPQGGYQGGQDAQGAQPQGGSYQGGQPANPPAAQGGGGDGLVTRVTEAQFGEGIIEVSGKGFGFLREAKRNFVQTPADIFVTPEVCRKYNLRDGQWIKGEIRRSSRGPQLFRLTALNGEDPEKFRNLPNFEELTSINPKKRIKLETVPERYTTRVMDLMTPIGKGQRGLIVAPPRTGKTTLLQHIAEAVVKNHTEVKLIILLVDERPEEVTEIRRSVPGAEIMASSNDSDLKSHTRIALLAIERAKRLVEAGQDVFILLDSITRMARAFNNAMSGGRGTQSGGLAVGALEIPRKLFAAARNTEEAGSLTIMATALIETNSKMDDAIFQEFKGTGNMELVLDRKISDQRIYPAVDIFLSGTRREELLLAAWELDKINVIRRGLAGHKPIEAIERLLGFLKKFPTNTQMLASLPG